MNQDRYDKVLAFLRRLTDEKFDHELKDYREDAISVIVRVPGEFWEVDFLDDGTVDVERFVSNGHIDDESILKSLIAKFSDRETEPNHEAATAGK
jgi:hypothetical protein